jgi:hypothetical protein
MARSAGTSAGVPLGVPLTDTLAGSGHLEREEHCYVRHDLEASSAHASAFTSQVCDVGAGGQGVGVIRAQHPHQVGQQFPVQPQGLRAVPVLAGPAGHVGAGGQGVGVVRAQDPPAGNPQRVSRGGGKVTRKGSAVDIIVWQTGTARLLPRLLDGHTRGPVFLTGRRARVALPAADLDPVSGRARLSAIRSLSQDHPANHPAPVAEHRVATGTGGRQGHLGEIVPEIGAR